MRNTKYVMSGGLAFSEDKDMEKLRSFSLKGWHVRQFAFMGYKLEKGKSTDYIYSIDYCSLNDNDAEEYFDFFLSSGWEHISSNGYIHLFRALPGTKPIHSHQETVVEKHHKLGSSMKWFTLSLTVITVLSWITSFLSTGSLQKILYVTAAILSVIAIPAVWTTLSAYKNKWNAQGKKGIATLSKIVPLIFLAVSLLILFVVNDRWNPFLIVVYMVIGAVTLPTVIWGLTSLYQKIVR